MTYNPSYITYDELFKKLAGRSRLKKTYDWLRHRLPYIIIYELRPVKKSRWFFQRGRRGWADCDAWDTDSYTSRVVVEMLDQMIKYNSSSPMSMTPVQWEEILMQIRDGFLAAQEIINMKYVNYDDTLERFNKGMDLFKEYFFALWD